MKALLINEILINKDTKNYFLCPHNSIASDEDTRYCSVNCPAFVIRDFNEGPEPSLRNYHNKDAYNQALNEWKEQNQKIVVLACFPHPVQYFIEEPKC